MDKVILPEMKGAIFLDRDGTINVLKKDKFITKWEEFEFVDDAIPALKILYDTGLPLYVVTNQKGINIGLVTMYQVMEIHNQMCKVLKQNKIHIRNIFICPHTEEERCPCRKPEPGGIYWLAVKHGINLSKSYIIGDTLYDMKAGFNAGISNKYLINKDSVRDIIDHGFNGLECRSLTIVAMEVKKHVGK